MVAPPLTQTILLRQWNTSLIIAMLGNTVYQLTFIAAHN